MARNLVCSECGGTMTEGIIVEPAGYLTPSNATYWMEGFRDLSIWGNLKEGGKAKYYINSYRCERCGFMKLYAGPDHSSEKQE